MTIILLYVIGFLCIIISIFGKRKQKLDESIQSMGEIHEQEVINFNQEIEKYHQQFERLNSVDVDKISNLIVSVDQLVTILTENRTTMMAQSESYNQEEIMMKPEISTPKNLMIRPEIEQKMKEYYRLKGEGKSLDEILKIIDMEKGELLFLDNLYKSIT